MSMSNPATTDAGERGGFRYKVTEVLDHRSAIVDKLQTRPLIMALGEVYMNPGDDQYEAGRMVAEEMRLSLLASEAFHVQREMVTLLRFAAADLDASDCLHHEMLPAEHGFLIFDEQVNPVPDVCFDEDGIPYVEGADESPINAIMWSLKSRTIMHPHDARRDQLVPGIWVTVFNDIRHPESALVTSFAHRHEVLRLMEEAQGRFRPSDRFHVAFGEPVGENDITLEQYYAMIDDPDSNVLDTPEDGAVATTNRFRIIVALFRLLNQTVLVETTQPPIDRSTRRRTERKDMTPAVTAVALRRRKKPTGTETEDPDAEAATRKVEWKHQWLVRGFWQWRHCGPAHPAAEEYEKGYHAKVYIAPYWKGPNDKPIHISDKVYNLIR